MQFTHPVHPLSTRRQLIRGALLSAAALAAPSLARASGQASGTVRIDGLGFPGSVSTEQGAPLQGAELADIRASNLSATHLTVGQVGTMPPLQAFEAIVRDIVRWEGEIDAHNATLARIRGARDIDAARAAGTTGLIYGLQDGVSFEDDLERLPALQHLGVRVIQPTYNRRNLLGDGCMEPANAGLSRTGVEAVRRIQDLGMLLDLSHCGRRTAADALAAATGPVAFTHTGCDALAPHPRHRTNAEIRGVSASGGVTGIFIMPYLAKGRQPSAADVIRHLEHAVDVGGEDHVALGTDGAISPTELTESFRAEFREITRRRREQGIAAPFETETGYLFASDLNMPRRFDKLGEMLLARGHSQPRVDKLLGGNLQRLFRDSWSS